MMVAVAAMLLAAPAWSIPWPANTTVTWYHALDDSAIGVCPAGDFSQLDVTVRDQDNQPMGGYPIAATFSNALIKANPGGGQIFTGIADAAGHVRIPIAAGVDNSGLVAIQSDVTVTCGPYTIKIYYDLFVVSPDYDASYYVDAADYSVFGSHWHINDPTGMKDCASDFSRDDPRVENADYAVFISHWHH